MIKRYLEQYIRDDLKDKMVFVSGPRQVGKTTLAKDIAEKFYKNKYEYLNWDNRQDRRTILSGVFNPDRTLVVFDEIHKFRDWKNYLKGEYDKYKERFHIMVTGSARLDIYRKGGDSLLGRQRSYRLHPLSVGELISKPSNHLPFKELEFPESSKTQRELLTVLLKFSGFPEIFVKQSEKEQRRWHNERVDRLIKDEIRDIENLRDLSSLQIMVELLPSKVGSLLSINSFREDLNVTHKTVSLWINILEKFYYHFRIYPFQSTRIKSLRKEPKVYLWDYSEVPDEGARFENLVGAHLLKYCDYLVDTEGYKAQLFYLRDKEQREVDFLVAVAGKPWFCVEVKSTYKDIPNALRYFGGKLNIPFVYEVIQEEGIDIIKDNIRIMSASKFLAALV